MGKPIFLLLGTCLALIATLSCGDADSTLGNAPKAHDYPNILNYTGVPDSATDRSVFAYSDLGAWHGYALPEPGKLTGSFIGPYLLTQDNGVWIGESIAQMEIVNLRMDEVVNLDRAEVIASKAYPHKLEQALHLQDLGVLIETQLTFASNRTALIQVKLQNLEEGKPLELAVRWHGESFLPEVKFMAQKQGVRIDFGKNENIGCLSVGSNTEFDYEIEDNKYGLQIIAKRLSKGDTWSTSLAQTFCFSAAEWNREEAKLAHVLAKPNEFFEQNERRWDDMLLNVFGKMRNPFRSRAHQEIAVKCLLTLHNNWRSAAGFLKHDGLFPSYNYEWFNGFWSWDSWKHAVAIANFNPQLAQEQILAMYDFQDDLGMIADCVYRDTIIESHNWRDTKPPLSAWAIWKVYEKSKDEKFLKHIFPKLEKYHRWWFNYRDINENGLCEYGSTDASLIAAKWESGMDNAVRFDDAKILNNAKGGGSMNRESVDLNAYLAAELSYLAKIAAQLEKIEKATSYHALAQSKKKRIQDHFYAEKEGWFFDKKLMSKELLKTYGSEGWIPLWANCASPEQAERVVATMLDTTKFATHIPFPTLAADHPKFKPLEGYWRGPVWLDQAYFAIEALRNYGYEKEALQFSHQLFDRLEGLKNSDGPIRENYHPLTGQGMESNHFSWSAAHLLLLLGE